MQDKKSPTAVWHGLAKLASRCFICAAVHTLQCRNTRGQGGLSFCRGTLRAVNTVGVEGREVLFLAIKGSVFRKHHHASRYPSGRRTRQAEHSRCGKSWNSDRTECFSEKRKHSTRVSSAAGIQGCRSIGHVLHHCRSVTSLPLRPIWVRDPPHFAFSAPPPTLPPKLHTQL